jgi:predicted secreted acid phosphatase
MNDVRNALIDYYETSSYTEELSKMATDFNKHVTFNPKVFEHSHPPLVVFDIDETLLNNYDLYKKDNFVYDADSWSKWTEEADAPAVAPIVDVLHTLNENNIAVALITGRHEASRNGTLTNLERVGITPEHYVTLVLRNEEESKLTAAEYKARHRKAFSEDYSVVGCVGDQYSDCAGGYTGWTLKAPNYMYFIA